MNDLKMPPHSVEAEQSLLGCFLLDPMISYKVREINVNDFYKEAHKIIFENIKALVNENKPVDIVTLTDKIKLSGYLDSIGGVSYVTSLSTIVPTTSNIDYYIKIVQGKSLARAAIKQAQEILNQLYEEKVEDATLSIDSLKNEINGNRSLENNFVDNPNDLLKYWENHKGLVTMKQHCDEIIKIYGLPEKPR